MFIGHGMAAFALVAAVASARGYSADRALELGVLAGLFATAPDLDILYGPVGLLGGVSGLADATATFWETGNLVHRGPTHSVVVGVATALALGLVHARNRLSRVTGLVALTVIAAVVLQVSGLLHALVTMLFLGGVIATLWLARRWSVSPRAVTVVALVGLITHPFGDVFTGSPPAFLYPLETVLLGERVLIAANPTGQLLGAFFVELGFIWVAVLVAFRLSDRSVREAVDSRAWIGIAYGGAAFVLPAPTLETSWHFVVSVLSVGVIGVRLRSFRRTVLARGVVTGLSAITLGALSFGLATLVA
jgi:membrane-bound metal-dependent hydrolase YbcI (DUF457 family)